MNYGPSNIFRQLNKGTDYIQNSYNVSDGVTKPTPTLIFKGVVIDVDFDGNYDIKFDIGGYNQQKLNEYPQIFNHCLLIVPLSVLVRIRLSVHVRLQYFDALLSKEWKPSIP